MTHGIFYFNIIHSILEEKYNSFLSAAVILLLTPVYSYFFAPRSTKQNEILIALGYYLMIFIIIIFTTKGKWFSKLFVTIFSFMMWMCSSWLFNIITHIIPGVTIKDALSYTTTLFYYISMILFQFSSSFIYVAIIYLIKNRTSKNLNYKNKYIIYLIFPITHIMCSLMVSICIQSMDSVTYNNFIKLHPGYETAICILASICMLVDFALIFAVDLQSKTENKNTENEKLILKYEMDYSQVKMLSDEKNQFRKIKHDMSNLLTTAQGFIEIGKPEKALQIMRSANDDLSHIAHFAISSNDTINTIFSMKTDKASEINTVLNADIEESHAVMISDYELCRLLTNIIDNALNAVESLPQNDRHINIRLIINNEKLIIISHNPYSQQPHRFNPNKSEDHGNGIGIINNIAKKYGGKYERSFSDGIYTAEVTLKNIALK